MRENRTERPAALGTRRDFIRKAATGTAALAAGAGVFPKARGADGKGPEVSIVLDGSDPLLKKATVVWAAGRLKEALKVRGFPALVCPTVEESPGRNECILAVRSDSPLGREALNTTGASVPATPEAVGLLRARAGKRDVALVCGSDERGLVYGFLELADQVIFSNDPVVLLRNLESTV